MASAKCHLELYADGQWLLAAEVRVEDAARGFQSGARVDYDFDYLDTMAAALGARDARAVSCRYPLSYQEHAEPAWPSFLLDLIPSGAARRFWEAQLDLSNTSSNDWSILVAGAGNPPGNVRVAEAAPPRPPSPKAHPGFAREDVLNRADGFIEYAREQGASIAGGSGAAGDAPKFLLREDRRGRWHADGALADADTAQAWIVKFPRSPRAADRLVLEAEATYYAVAARMGARTAGPLSWERDCLFIPRFDRDVTRLGRKGPRGRRHVERLGLESLCSLAGVSEFGTAVPKEELAAAVARFTRDPSRDLQEFVLRDVLDVALGNTDNHARNTAVLKAADGDISLSPLYDFAPMMLDPQGIARVCRWSVERGGFPDWSHVADTLGSLGADVARTKTWLRSLAPAVRKLPRVMRDEAVPATVIEAVEDRVNAVARMLAEVT